MGEKALFVLGIDPGARHYASTVARPYLMLEGVDQHVERRGIYQSFFHQQRFKGFHPQRRIGWDSLMIVIVCVCQMLCGAVFRAKSIIPRYLTQTARFDATRFSQIADCRTKHDGGSDACFHSSCSGDNHETSAGDLRDP